MILVALAVVLLLVLLNGVFSMSELAVVSARKARLQGFADRGDKGAKLALEMAEHPTRFLSAVQVGITLIGIFAGAYGQATVAGALDAWLETTTANAGAKRLVAEGRADVARYLKGQAKDAQAS